MPSEQALLAQLLLRRLGLPERLETHSRKHGRRLRELHLRVLDDLDEIAPRVAEAKPPARLDLDAGRLERLTHPRSIVDHEAEVTAGTAVGRVALGQREELVAHVEKRHSSRAAAELEIEDAAVEGHRLLDVADLQRHVIDSDHPSHLLSLWGAGARSA